jgi:aspartyl-tRNA(Asn)/glutamyl-tRNA(Gln) amidotransferase subunit A
VVSRIRRGAAMTAAQFLELESARKRWIAAVEQRLAHAHAHALVLPTVPVVAPAIAELQASDDAYGAANLLMLRNPTLINFLDGCALSLPCHRPGEAPVGLMLAAPGGHDAQLLALGTAAESVLGARGLGTAPA